MTKIAEQFAADTAKMSASADVYERNALLMGQYEQQHETAKRQYANLKLARERAAYYKWKVLENLDKYLIEFESSVIKRGGKVIWVTDAEQACTEIDAILEKAAPKHILKSKSTVCEELGISEYLRSKGHALTETDTGEFIVDLAGEAPWHSVTPAMHKTRAQITELLNPSLGVSLDADPEHIVRDIRQHLRSQFNQQTVAITGANFLIADSGMAAITENEGNVRMALAFAHTHIVVAGIDKIIPGVNELDTYWPLLATFGTGQKLTAYNTLVGPKQQGDADGAADFYVLLVDNGRADLLAQPDQRQALSCINCGACSNVCPVFKTIGGHVYATAQNGPIGQVKTPFTHGLDAYKHLSYASPLCGKCTDMCPVNIDLHNHLSRNRRDSVAGGYTRKTEGILWYSWKKIMLNRKNMNKSASVKSFMLKSFFKSDWGPNRVFPEIADKSFNQLWREKNNLK
jgi:L-lactate dehydrogenase complex protein LldF